MSHVGRQTTIGVIVAENDDGVWCTQVAPNAMGLPIEFYQSTGRHAVYQAARRAGWDDADLGTLNYVWVQLRDRSVRAMRERTAVEFWIGGMTT